MKSWVGSLTPPTGAAVGIARELDAYDVPPEFDLAGDETDPAQALDPAPVVVVQRDGVKKWILRSIAMFTSASCAITSVYFSNIWFSASQPKVIAAIMSLTVVATLTAAPELASSLARKKNYFIAVAVIFIWVIATVFSMSSTIGGIYNARTVAISASEQVTASGTAGLAAAMEIENLESRIERLRATIETDQGAAASYQATIDNALGAGEDPLSKKMSTLVANRTNAIKRVSATEAEISAAEKRINDLVPLAAAYRIEESAVAAGRADFASWLGGRFGVGPEQMEFILAAFPAVFIDLIAPAMMVVAFTL